jgi:hypothetical protein
LILKMGVRGQSSVFFFFCDFTVKQHSMTLMSATSCAAEFAPVAVMLLHKEMPATLRLVGVKVTQLVPTLLRSGCARASRVRDPRDSAVYFQ